MTDYLKKKKKCQANKRSEERNDGNRWGNKQSESKRKEWLYRHGRWIPYKPKAIFFRSLFSFSPCSCVWSSRTIVFSTCESLLSGSHPFCWWKRRVGYKQDAMGLVITLVFDFQRWRWLFYCRLLPSIFSCVHKRGTPTSVFRCIELLSCQHPRVLTWIFMIGWQVGETKERQKAMGIKLDRQRNRKEPSVGWRHGLMANRSEVGNKEQTPFFFCLLETRAMTLIEGRSEEWRKSW